MEQFKGIAVFQSKHVSTEVSAEKKLIRFFGLESCKRRLARFVKISGQIPQAKRPGRANKK